jgi:serine/threonine protein kinase
MPPLHRRPPPEEPRPQSQAAPAPSSSRFEYLARLGAGAFGVAVKVRVLDPDLVQKWGAEVVAVKVPQNDEGYLTLRQESLSNAELRGALHNHPGIGYVVAYYDEMIDPLFGPLPVMVMALVPDGSLRDLIGYPGSGRPRLPIAEAVGLLDGITLGLAAVHEYGYVHRDIKPDNILLDGRTPKIGDFGLAKALMGNYYLKTTGVGSRAYEAPEEFVEGADSRADVFSVGVMMYEMFTGVLPYDVAKLEQRGLEGVYGASPPPPSTLRPDLPAWLDDVVLKALAYRPKDRHGNGGDLNDALHPGRRITAALAEVRELMRDHARLEDAQRRLEDLVATAPDSAEMYELLGVLHGRRFQREEAVASFSRAIDLDPGNAKLHWELALAYQQIGDNAKMAASLEKALELGLEDRLAGKARSLLTALHTGTL